MSDITDTPHQVLGDNIKYASFAKRLVAYLIDVLIIGIVSTVAGFAWKIIGLESLASVLGIVIGIGYSGYFWTTTGATPGKALMKLKVVDVNGHLLSWGGAILRYICYIVSGIALGLGFIWVLIDKNNQGWHDKIAGTFVIDEGE